MNSIGFFIIFIMCLHFSSSQYLTDEESTDSNSNPPCECKESKQQFGYQVTFDNCPHSRDCLPTITRFPIESRRNLDNSNSNVNVNTNTNAVEARRSLNGNSNVNVNTNSNANANRDDTDSVITLDDLGSIIGLKSGIRRFHSSNDHRRNTHNHNYGRRNTGSHAAHNGHSNSNRRNVYVQTKGRNVEVYGDSDGNDNEDFVESIIEDDDYFREREPTIFVTARRSHGHSNTHNSN